MILTRNLAKKHQIEHENHNIRYANESRKIKTLAVNSSVESQEPIFNNAVKAGAAAEPNSRAEANKGSNCRNQ